MKTSTEISELAKGLSRAQGQFTAAERAHTARVQSKKGEGSSYSYNYADLQAYLDVVREPLAAAGLSFVQLPTVKGDEASVVTMLMHESGQFIESDPLCLTVDHEPDKRPTPQAIGSAITYARRYSLSAITGMASEADDDGAGASGLNAETGKRQPNPVCPNCSTSLHVIKGKEEYGGGWLCWKSKGGCGAKWHDEPKEELPDYSQGVQSEHGDQLDKAPKANGKQADAKKIAAEHGMKTADELEKPKEKTAYGIALEEISKAVRNHDQKHLAAVSKRIKERVADGTISAQQDAMLITELSLAEKKIEAMEREPAAA